MVFTIVSLGLFCFLALFYTNVYRSDHGLRKCYALTNAEEPFSKASLIASEKEDEASENGMTIEDQLEEIVAGFEPDLDLEPGAGWGRARGRRWH